LPIWAYEDIEDSTFYADVGTLLLINPTGGVGYRLQHNHHGLDIAARLSLGFTLQAKLSGMYVYYCNPQDSSQYYVGVGGAGLYLRALRLFGGSKSSFGLCSELLFGKEFHTDSFQRRFLQIQIGFPTYYFNTSIDGAFIPMPTITYGFMF
jgi:hypothetical protein